MPRPRKPTVLKIAEGDQPCRINGMEPTTRKGLGPMPDYVSEDLNASEAWSRIETQLSALELIQEADTEAVVLYCMTWSLYIQACEEIKAKGLTVQTTTTTKANPAIAIRNECQRQLTRLLIEFGMTPAARAGLHVGDRTKADPLTEWIAAKARRHAQHQSQSQGAREERSRKVRPG